MGGQVTGKADARAARSEFPYFLASVVSCILLSGKPWPKLACREGLHGEQACAEVLGRQAPLAVEPAQKILSRKVLLPGVAIQAAGDQVAVRIASRLGDRHHMIQAVGPAGGPAQTVKAHATIARVDGLAQGRSSQEIQLVQVDPAGQLVAAARSRSAAPPRADLPRRPHLPPMIHVAPLDLTPV